MVRNGTPRIRATERTLAILSAVVGDRGQSSVSAIARSLNTPVQTAHRQIATLVGEGFLARGDLRQLYAGPRLLQLLSQIDEKEVIVASTAPRLEQLAHDLTTVIQLGTLENDMVTYRIKVGVDAERIFTKVGMQLEAYCSGVGKVLLAHLSRSDRAAYLASGPFPAITRRTMTDPEQLLNELVKVRSSGHAFDRGEIADGMVCVAVPICAPNRRVLAAISATFTGDSAECRAQHALGKMYDAARDIELTTFGDYNLQDRLRANFL